MKADSQFYLSPGRHSRLDWDSLRKIIALFQSKISTPTPLFFLTCFIDGELQDPNAVMEAVLTISAALLIIEGVAILEGTQIAEF